jgi:uncharacterized protein YfdQ (DUF2303 family)
MSDAESKTFGEIAESGDVAAALAAGVTLAEPVELDPTKVYDRVLPDCATHEIIDLERFLSRPRRATGTVRPQTVDDLVRYVQRHDDEESTTLWVDEDGQQVSAVLNDHPSGQSAWGDHRAHLQLRLTPEWRRWTALDGKLVGQEDFAEHIELGLPEIVSPDGATMLEIAQSIEGSKSADFKSGHRLQDGNVAIEYVEQTSARAGQKGELDIPARFRLAIAPFLGEEPAEIQARFRYRIAGGGLRLGYLLERPELVIRESIDRIGDRLASQFGEHRVFVGTPRS